MNYFDIRNCHYERQRKIFALNGEDMDNWFRYPYSALKARIYIELSAALVFLLQRTKVHPNHITILYALAGCLGGLLLSLGNDLSIIAALLIFVLKSVLDWSDGLLARLTNRCSDEGAVLDPWSAVVNSFGFLIGIGFYLFNRSDNVLYIYMMVFIIFLRGIDPRKFAYLLAMNDIIERRGADGHHDGGSHAEPVGSKAVGFDRQSRMTRFGQLVTSILDDRARSVDFVCLLILIEVWAGRLLLIPLIYWIYVIKYFLIFSGGFYLLYFKKIPSQLKALFAGPQLS